MKELTELVELISRNKIRHIELVGTHNGYHSSVQQLYTGIVDGKFESEESAAHFFYPDSPLQKQYFLRLKKRLTRRLYNTLFFIDVSDPSYSDIQKAYYTCYKNYATTKILIGKGARRAAIPLAKSTLTNAIRFEFTDLIIDLARILRMHYGTIEGNRKKYKEYNELLKRHETSQRAELLAEEYFIDLAVNFVKSRASQTEIEQVAEKYASDLEAFPKRFQTYRSLLYAYRVLVLRHQIANDYQKTLEVCKEAIESFRTKDHLASKSAIFTFQFVILSCCIQLKRYKEGEKTALACLKILPEGSQNWYSTLELYIILSFHTQNFQKAREIFQQATQHKGFKSQYENINEQWLIYEAFIHYFLEIGLLTSPKTGKPSALKRFRVGKFLNEVPTFSKDKRGTNISIIIIQILFLLHQHKYGDVIDKMEALNMYCHRYLRRDDTYRSNCFIKMLLQLPHARFNRVAAIRKARKYFDKLKEVPLEVAKQGSEIEIVPYELLWKLVIESLDHSFHEY